VKVPFHFFQTLPTTSSLRIARSLRSKHFWVAFSNKIFCFFDRWFFSALREPAIQSVLNLEVPSIIRCYAQFQSLLLVINQDFAEFDVRNELLIHNVQVNPPDDKERWSRSPWRPRPLNWLSILRLCRLVQNLQSTEIFTISLSYCTHQTDVCAAYHIVDCPNSIEQPAEEQSQLNHHFFALHVHLMPDYEENARVFDSSTRWPLQYRTSCRINTFYFFN
jgi:hypothetical protein